MAAGAVGLAGALVLFPAEAVPRREPEPAPTRLRLAAAPVVQGRQAKPNPAIPSLVPIFLSTVPILFTPPLFRARTEILPPPLSPFLLFTDFLQELICRCN